MSVWIYGEVEPALDDAAQEELQDWLEEFDACSEDTVLDSTSFVIGWIDDGQWIYLTEHLSEHLPEGTSGRLWFDFDNADTGTDRLADQYFGPRAVELEAEDTDSEIEKLRKKREQLLGAK